MAAPRTEQSGPFASALPAGRLLGVPLRLHWSTPLLIVVLAVELGTSVLPAWAPGRSQTAYSIGALLGAAGLLTSLLVHESAHARAARRSGLAVTDMTVWALGGVTRIGRARTPREQGIVAAVGPLASLLLGVVLFGAGLAVLHGTAARLPAAVLLWLGGANLLLAGFNLLPAAPLDGGHVLAAILWARTGSRERADRVGARAGLVVGAILGTLGLVQLLRGGFGGLWSALLGLFITMSAQAQLRRLELLRLVDGVPVSAVMSTPVETAPDWHTVERFADDAALTTRHSHLPLLGPDGRVTGVLAVARLRTVPARAAASVRLAQLAAPVASVPRAAPDTTVADALTRSEPTGPRILVLDDGRLVGIVTWEDISRLARRRLLRGPEGG